MFDIEHTPLALTVAQAGKLIEAVVAANIARLGTITTDITPFHSRTIPSISAHDYLYRVSKYVGLENDSVLAVLVYLDRITRSQIHRPSLAISPYNIHRLILSAIVVAHKFNSDIFLNNVRYSKVGGIPLAELNQLELELLFMIKFDLKVDSVELQHLGEWVMAWPGCLSDSSLSSAGSGSVCVLSQYYEEIAMARRSNASLYAQGIIVDTSPGGSTNAHAASSLVSAATMVMDAEDAVVHSDASNDVLHAVPYVETQQQQSELNPPAERPLSRKRSFRHQYHPYQQQQQHPTSHDRNSLELATPSSMTTACTPATPPVFCDNPSYAIDDGAATASGASAAAGVASMDSENMNNSVPATRSPHVAFAKHPRLVHAGGLKAIANGSDGHQSWGLADMLCQNPSTSSSSGADAARFDERELAGTTKSRRHHRLQAIAAMHPVSAAPSGSSAATRPGTVDLFQSASGDS
ncbi:cyclin-like protein interacting with PHO85 [Coemansia sp. RSA 1939]|nr:cyclin-like protein interacting with PHO85 [Coemansia sp. RSA 1939]KAJ2687367.1 cyclin-like protein interacting with PHO85 [Coemansia sp. RSA 1285]